MGKGKLNILTKLYPAKYKGEAANDIPAPPLPGYSKNDPHPNQGYQVSYAQTPQYGYGTLPHNSMTFFHINGCFGNRDFNKECTPEQTYNQLETINMGMHGRHKYKIPVPPAPKSKDEAKVDDIPRPPTPESHKKKKQEEEEKAKKDDKKCGKCEEKPESGLRNVEVDLFGNYNHLCWNCLWTAKGRQAVEIWRESEVV